MIDSNVHQIHEHRRRFCGMKSELHEYRNKMIGILFVKTSNQEFIKFLITFVCWILYPSEITISIRLRVSGFKLKNGGRIFYQIINTKDIEIIFLIYRNTLICYLQAIF